MIAGLKNMKEVLTEDEYINLLITLAEDVSEEDSQNFDHVKWLLGAFVWDKSAQGHEYWQKICKRLSEK